MGKTIQYYENNAQTFIDDTLTVDMSEFYHQFLPLLPVDGAVLDAGCGSGRDTLYFLGQGFQVKAFDASPSLVDFARKLTGIDVQGWRFDEAKYSKEFDGIWACASLLHLSLDSLEPVLSRMAGWLKDNGVIYVSFKHGNGERQQGGRKFTDLDEAGLSGLIERIDELQIEKLWLTADRRAGRENELWLNAILRYKTS